MKQEELINGIMSNSKFASQALTKVGADDFEDTEAKIAFKFISTVWNKYKKVANKDELRSLIATSNKLNPDDKESTLEWLDTHVTGKSNMNGEILLDSTLEFLRGTRFMKLIDKSIDLVEDPERAKTTKADLFDNFRDLMALSFNTDVGVSYNNDADARFEFYKEDQTINVKSGWSLVDKSFGSKGTLNAFLAPSNVGKTMILASYASTAKLAGYDVGVITLEDGDFPWLSRIDANILNTNLKELRINNKQLRKAFAKSMEGATGDIRIKEFPSNITSNDVDNVMKEWAQIGFTPDIVFVDYLGIMGPIVETDSLYIKGKKTTEELRNVAKSWKIPFVTALQANRSAYDKEELDLTDIAESLGYGMGLDSLIGIVQTDEEDEYALQAIKSRRLNKNKTRPMLVHFDTEHQRVTAVDGEVDEEHLNEEDVNIVNTYTEVSEGLSKLDDDEDVFAGLDLGDM